MGFQDGIICNGIFPKVAPQVLQMEAEQNHLESLEGWANYTSAEEENDDLQQLVKDYVDRGFCHLSPSLEEATKELGRQPIVNRLGVIVKEKVEGDKASRKARIIWDLRRSGANQSCDQAERVLLPRLLDLVAGVLEGYRQSKPCWVAAIDIKDAFMNVPVMRDRYALVAAKPKSQDSHDLELIIFNTLVFGRA
eukprot:s7174_g1.t1